MAAILDVRVAGQLVADRDGLAARRGRGDVVRVEIELDRQQLLEALAEELRGDAGTGLRGGLASGVAVAARRAADEEREQLALRVAADIGRERDVEFARASLDVDGDDQR